MKFKIKVASYKNSKSIFASFIRLQQAVLQGLPNNNARFSHSELVFCYNDDPDVLERLYKLENLHLNNFPMDRHRANRFNAFKCKNLWFSSSETDGGTRFKFISDNKNNWVYDELEVTKKEYLAILDYCIKNNKNPYGWFSIIFTQGLKTLWFVKRKNPFCSQITLQGLQIIWLYAGVNSIETNPGKLSLLVENIKEDYKNFKNITN